MISGGPQCRSPILRDCSGRMAWPTWPGGLRPLLSPCHGAELWARGFCSVPPTPSLAYPQPSCALAIGNGQERCEREPPPPGPVFWGECGKGAAPGLSWGGEFPWGLCPLSGLVAAPAPPGVRGRGVPARPSRAAAVAGARPAKAAWAPACGGTPRRKPVCGKLFTSLGWGPAPAQAKRDPGSPPRGGNVRPLGSHGRGVGGVQPPQGLGSGHGGAVGVELGPHSPPGAEEHPDTPIHGGVGGTAGHWGCLGAGEGGSGPALVGVPDLGVGVQLAEGPTPLFKSPSRFGMC